MNALSFPKSGLLLPFDKERRWIALTQIVRLEGEGNYTTCIFADGSQLVVALTLKRLANRLPDGQFLRSHRKHLINRAFIEAVQRHTATIQLANGDCVSIARRRANGLFHAFRQTAPSINS